MAERRFSHAIADGEGISVVVAVADAGAARTAERQRAEALVVAGDPSPLREATALPILWRGDAPVERAAEVADAFVLVFEALEDDEGRLEEEYRRVVELGLDCVIDVRNENELEAALERVDPEILLLSPRDAATRDSPIECVLGLLKDVPAGKLAIADLPLTTAAEVEELERAGVDAVIVDAGDIGHLVGQRAPEV